MPRIEVLPNTTTTSAPGWAYVAVPVDGYLDPSKAPIIPSGSRRNKSTAVTDSSVASTRQEAAVLKRLAELDRDGSAGKEIPIPDISPYVHGAEGTSAGARKLGKTQSTRRILSSAKTFANHLADEEAARAQEHHAGASDLRKSRKKSSISAIDRDVIMEDVSDEEDTTFRRPTQLDAEKELIAVREAPTITQAEIDELLAAPALSYNAARAAPPDEKGPPSRTFCEICGYWGRVKCIKCGAKVCSLDCKEQHMLECSRRYA